MPSLKRKKHLLALTSNLIGTTSDSQSFGTGETACVTDSEARAVAFSSIYQNLRRNGTICVVI